MEKEEEIEIMLFCDDEEHRNELNSNINRRSQEIADAIGQLGAKVSVISFARTSDLNGTIDYHRKNLKVIALSCAGRTDVPYDLFVLRHRFSPHIKIIGEMDSELNIDIQERAYNIICCWHADDVFSKQDRDIVDAIIRVLKD